MTLLRYSASRGHLLVPGGYLNRLIADATPFIPEVGREQAHPNQILHALEERVIATVRAAGPILSKLRAEHDTRLQRLARGHVFSIGDIESSLLELGRHISSGDYQVPPEVLERDFYAEAAPFLINDVKGNSDAAVVDLRESAKLFFSFDSEETSNEELAVELVKQAEAMLTQADASKLDRLTIAQEETVRTFVSLNEVFESGQGFQLKLSFVLRAVGALKIWQSASEPPETEQTPEQEEELIKTLLKRPDYLASSGWLEKSLKRHGFTHLYQIAIKSEAEFAALQGVGSSQVEEMRQILQKRNLDYGLVLKPEILEKLRQKTHDE